MNSTVTEKTSAVAPSVLLNQLNWRYAVKKYDATRKLSPEVWNALEHALVLSPSGYGFQPWKFFVITDPAVREKLKAVSYGQSQITDASHLVVFASRTDLNENDVDRYVKRTAKVRNVSEESLNGFRTMLNGFAARGKNGFDVAGWAARQVYIALGTLITSAAVLGVDATPMEGFDPKGYDEVLGLAQQGYQARVVATVGYRAPDDAYAALPKVRYANEDVVAYI